MERTQEMLQLVENVKLRTYFDIAVRYRVESHIFAIFAIFLSRVDVPLEDLRDFMDAYPSLVYCILKKYIPSEPTSLPANLAPIIPSIIHAVIRSANELSIASLAALERLAPDIAALTLKTYLDTLWLTVLSIRAPTLVQEVLLVLHEARAATGARDPALAFAHKHALAIAFDRAEEAADVCPCDDSGRPRKQRTRPARAKLVPPGAQAPSGDGKGKAPEESGGAEVSNESTLGAGEKVVVVAHTRVDNPTAIRIHSHVRLQLAAIAPHATRAPPVLDALVLRAGRGEMHLAVQQPLPPEWKEVEWDVLDAGGTATGAAMLAAVLKLALKGYECCKINHILEGLDPVESGAAALEDAAAVVQDGGTEDAQEEEASDDIDPSLNDSQKHAVRLAINSKLCLIWGPPGEWIDVLVSANNFIHL